MKEYLMLISENLENYSKTTPEEMQADIAQHIEWVEALVSKGHFKGGNPLMPNGKYISTAAGVITDGPYTEVKEGISGYYFLLAESLEQAAEIARGCPSLKAGATLEVREVIQSGE
jgi:hypothetical protein